MTYLDNIFSPSDVKKMKRSELPLLANEVRTALLNRVSRTGGHVGPNLGMVEAVIALHYVFESPKDKIVFDVSHQCYAHKILTGRKDAFLNPDKFDTVTGFTNPAESEHDFFTVGHTSTAVSLACGLAKSRDLLGEKGNVVAVVGDGSLSGGEALEGLDFAAELNGNLIIVVNDNEMSIAENHGGLYQNLRLLRETNGTAACNMFKAWGLDYVYIADGNDIDALIDAFSKVKDSVRPVVVHMHTEKGHGYRFAMQDKEKWHFNMPFDLETGKNTFSFDGEDFGTMTADYLIEKAKTDKKLVVLNAGTPGAIAFTPTRRAQMGKQFVDVGIAEEHAVAMSSALAKGGCKPVFWVLSSFVQRTYDQLSQDLALNKNPAVILVSWDGIGANDATHLGTFDISMMSNIPNLRYLAPATKEEYFAMLDWAIDQTKTPVVIRVPSVVLHQTERPDASYDVPAYRIAKQGSDVAVLALGAFWKLGQDVVAELKKHGIDATLVNPRFVDIPDETVLNGLKKDHQVVVTLEDGILDGGFGEKIARFYGASPVKVLTYGAKKEFTDKVPQEELYQRYRLTPAQIVEDVNAVLKEK